MKRAAPRVAGALPLAAPRVPAALSRLFRLSAALQLLLSLLLLAASGTDPLGGAAGACGLGGAAAGLAGAPRGARRAGALYAALTLALVALAARHLVATPRLAQWRCGLAAVARAQGRVAEGQAGAHARAGQAFSALALRLGGLDDALTSIHAGLRRDPSPPRDGPPAAADPSVPAGPPALEDPLAGYYRALWRLADRDFVLERAAAARGVAAAVAGLREGLDAAAEDAGGLLGASARRELEARASRLLGAAARLGAAASRGGGGGGRPLDPDEMERQSRDVERSAGAVTDFLGAAEQARGAPPASAARARELRERLARAAPPGALTRDLDVLRDALGRVAGGEAHYRDMDIGPVGRVREAWEERFRGAAPAPGARAAEVDAPAGRPPEECAGRGDLAPWWLLAPALANAAVGAVAAPGTLLP